MSPEPVTKYAAATGVPLAVTLSEKIPGFDVDASYLIAIGVALVAAWFARAGQLYRADRTWKEIGKDFIYSLMLGATVGIFAVALIQRLRLSPIDGLLVTWFLAFGGMPIIDLARAYLTRGWDWLKVNIADDVMAQEKRREALARKREEAHLMMLENSRQDRERMARQLKGESDEDSTG